MENSKLVSWKEIRETVKKHNLPREEVKKRIETMTECKQHLVDFFLNHIFDSEEDSLFLSTDLEERLRLDFLSSLGNKGSEEEMYDSIDWNEPLSEKVLSKMLDCDSTRIYKKMSERLKENGITEEVFRKHWEEATEHKMPKRYTDQLIDTLFHTFD